MVDTLAGMWLQIVVVVLMIAIVALMVVLGNETDHNFKDMLAAASVPGTFLLPVIGVLLVTSEWSQRTALITFTVTPRRTEVLAAKLLAGVLLALATTVLAVLLAALGNALAGGDWNFSLGVTCQVALGLVLGVAMGIAFGAAIKASAPAIVLFFVLPIVFGILGTIPALEDAAAWLDTSLTFAPLAEDALSSTEWARLGTSLLLWLLLPAVIGWWRITREDIS